MARPAKKQPQQKFEEPDEAEGWEDAVVESDDKDGGQLRLRDWRDVERFREMKELRRLVDDDYGLEEIFHIPVKPRSELRIPAPHTPAGKPGKNVVPVKPGAKGAPVKVAPPPVKAVPSKHAPAKPVAHAKPAHKPHAKVAAKHKPAKAKAKGKRK